VFDMDGTLVDSVYDWPRIRQRLGVASGSIIEQLNSLPEPERSEKWHELEMIEGEATRAAHLKPGARELLALLAERSRPTALVTNNSSINTANALSRFGLGFDVVLTRDSGMYKPSGTPIAEAVHRLGVRPEHTLAVGDSHYDIEAARDAGCGEVWIVFDGSGRHHGVANLSFPDLWSLIRSLQSTL
jgi:HAD superfamily hydrolase (TIGR01509 family)